MGMLSTSCRIGLGDDDVFDSSSEDDDADNASGTKDFDTLLMLVIY